MATKSGDAGVAVGVGGRPTHDDKTVMDGAPSFVNVRRMLDEEPFRVQFFQAVRMIQKMDPERGPVGHFVTPQGEGIRFSSLPTLGFPASELYALERLPNGQVRMTVQFMGMCAAISVLPAPYTEMVLARMKDKDHATAEFLDIFNHRMISFFYRGWEKYRFFIGYENGGNDKLSPRLLDLLGMGTVGLTGRDSIPDAARLNYVGLLARHVRSAASLKQILEDYFGVGVEVRQFAGTWRKLSAKNQTCFSGDGGASERLGVGVVAGDEVWDQHGRIRVSLGPMPLKQYLKFLPGQDAYDELAAWLRFYSNGSYETEVQLVLEREDAPGCELGAKGRHGPQLGLVSWLKTRPLDRDPADATYLVQ